MTRSNASHLLSWPGPILTVFETNDDHRTNSLLDFQNFLLRSALTLSHNDNNCNVRRTAARNQRRTTNKSTLSSSGSAQESLLVLHTGAFIVNSDHFHFEPVLILPHTLIHTVPQGYYYYRSTFTFSTNRLKQYSECTTFIRWYCYIYVYHI